MMKLNGEQGFTLIELMIVIAIIGILAAVAIPQLTGVRGKANVSAAKSEFKSLQTELEMYFTEEQEYPSGDESNLKSELDVNEDMLTGPDKESYSYSGGSQDYKVSWDVPNDDKIEKIELTPDKGIDEVEKKE